jgi:hypothetical protein
LVESYCAKLLIHGRIMVPELKELLNVSVGRFVGLAQNRVGAGI